MSFDLFAARFGSPSEPIVMFAGTAARALRTDAPLLFGTLDALGCRLDEIRVMSLERRSLVIASVAQPVESLMPVLLMSQVLGADVVDGDHLDDKHHAILKRPAHTRRGTALGLVAEDYFKHRFPDKREPTPDERARALGGVGRFDRSVAILRDELHKRPDDASLLFQLGDLLHRMDRPTEAIPLLQRSAELAPDQLDPRSSLALALMAAGRHRDAQQVYADLVTLAGGFGEWMNLASICIETRDFAEGQRAITQALALEPLSGHAHATAACLASLVGDTTATRSHGDQAMASLATEERQSRMYAIISNLVLDARRRIAAS